MWKRKTAILGPDFGTKLHEGWTDLFLWIPDVLAELVPSSLRKKNIDGILRPSQPVIEWSPWSPHEIRRLGWIWWNEMVAGCEPSPGISPHISQYLNYNNNCNNYTGWCFGTWFVWLSMQLGIINHPNWLTNSYCFKKGRLKPPTSNYITLRHPHDTHQKIIWLVVSFFP